MKLWISGLDHVTKLGAWTMETGVKGTFNNTVNNTSFHSLYDENWANHDLFFSEGSIREQILAASLFFKGKLSEKLDAELGIHYEHYTYHLDSEYRQCIQQAHSGSKAEL